MSPSRSDGLPLGRRLGGLVVSLRASAVTVVRGPALAVALGGQAGAGFVTSDLPVLVPVEAHEQPLGVSQGFGFFDLAVGVRVELAEALSLVLRRHGLPPCLQLCLGQVAVLVAVDAFEMIARHLRFRARNFAVAVLVHAGKMLVLAGPFAWCDRSQILALADRAVVIGVEAGKEAAVVIVAARVPGRLGSGFGQS